MGELTDMPNVGPKVAAKLRRLGIDSPEDLRGQDGEDLFERLCALDGRRHDPCLLDTFVAAVDFANGAPRAAVVGVLARATCARIRAWTYAPAGLRTASRRS